MNHLRHQKYNNKQLKNSALELENTFKSINISINAMDKIKEKRFHKEENSYNNTCTIG